MKEVDALFERLDKDTDVDGIRLDIANLIARSLTAKRETLGRWERVQFAHAIAALAQNIHGATSSATAWLRLCLVSIENAHLPSGNRPDTYAARTREVAVISFDQLMEDIHRLGGLES